MEKWILPPIEVDVFEHTFELPEDEQRLLESATEVMHRAYAPYSQFKVGAALYLQNGVVIQGSNQENMAYPSGLCAERVAFFHAGTMYPGERITKLAITAGALNFPSDHPIAPCGACRQSMLEYELNQKEPIVVIMRGLEGKTYRIKGVQSLLPLYFNEEGLKKTT
jgi:cytidine deaminase